MKYEVMDDVLFQKVMDENATMEELDAFIEQRRKMSDEENRKAAEERAAEEERLRKERERLAREALGLDPDAPSDKSH